MILKKKNEFDEPNAVFWNNLTCTSDREKKNYKLLESFTQQ